MKQCLIRKSDNSIELYGIEKPGVIVGNSVAIRNKQYDLEEYELMDLIDDPIQPTSTTRVTSSPVVDTINRVVNKVYTVTDIPLEELQKKAVDKFKSMYLATVNAKLKELDYDSLATVKLWENDATFGAEATRIITWYKALIAMNYQLINDVTNGVVPMPTDAEYQAMIDAVVF